MKKLLPIFFAILISMVSCKKDIQPETELPDLPPEVSEIHFTLSEPQGNLFDQQYQFPKDSIVSCYSTLGVLKLWAKNNHTVINLQFYLGGKPIKPGSYSFGPGMDFDFTLEKPGANYYFGNRSSEGFNGTGSIKVIQYGSTDNGVCFGKGNFEFVLSRENIVLLNLTKGYFKF
jgi:hypothetical protein